MEKKKNVLTLNAPLVGHDYSNKDHLMDGNNHDCTENTMYIGTNHYHLKSVCWVFVSHFLGVASWRIA